jgi:putative oxygen-independent coproporphyrinogen III oxidase
MKNIPLSLYIHFPWCINKCPYCDFNSYSAKNFPEESYLQALIKDLEDDLPKAQNRKLTSIFIGGGTPSLFLPQTIEKLLDRINKLFAFQDNIEITVEANPGTFDQDKLKSFYNAGIDRLSVGIQSFQDDKLKALGRIHDASKAKQAIKMIQKAGFDNFNLDLMCGLPNQNLEDALSDLKIAMSFNPKHISWYQLTIEQDTPFAKTKLKLSSEKLLLDIQEQGSALLNKNGFRHYEVSNFCKPNFKCEHNINYWEFGDYLGIGAGAHSKITIDDEVTRFWKTKNPSKYMNEKFIEGFEIVDKKTLPLEFMLNALRLIDGVPATLFQARTGLSLNDFEKQLFIAKEKGFLEDYSSVLKTTPLGQKFLNECLLIFC